MPDLPPDAPPDALLQAYLEAHAGGLAAPAGLYARGERLHDQLRQDPPSLPAWGRFLIAQGQLAAEHLHDDEAASRWFQEALHSVERHGDGEVAVAAGFNQGVLHERRADERQAVRAYRTAATVGFARGILVPVTLRAAEAAVRLSFEKRDRLPSDVWPLLKQLWLGWLWVRRHDPDQIDPDLSSSLGRTLAAFLLPEEDPTTLAADWRAWPPAALATPDGPWSDNSPSCLLELFAAAAEAADEHLRDECNDPGAPYRALGEALRRTADDAP